MSDKNEKTEKKKPKSHKVVGLDLMGKHPTMEDLEKINKNPSLIVDPYQIYSPKSDGD